MDAQEYYSAVMLAMKPAQIRGVITGPSETISD